MAVNEAKFHCRNALSDISRLAADTRTKAEQESDADLGLAAMAFEKIENDLKAALAEMENP